MTPPETLRTNRLVRPTVETKFHIDYKTWDRADRELLVYLRSHLCPVHQESYSESESDIVVDYVDPDSAEVTRLAGIQHILVSHCSRQADYINPATPLVNAVFRVFLANNNTPLTVQELGQILDRRSDTILRTLSGRRVYKGIRPYLED